LSQDGRGTAFTHLVPAALASASAVAAALQALVERGLSGDASRPAFRFHRLYELIEALLCHEGTRVAWRQRMAATSPAVARPADARRSSRQRFAAARAFGQAKRRTPARRPARD